MMNNSNELINGLYAELLKNSPDNISINIPVEAGVGRILQTVTRQGVMLSDWQMNYIADMNVQGTSSDEYLQIIFCINKGVSWGIAKQRGIINIQTGESCIYKGHGQTEHIAYSRHRDFHFKAIRIPLNYFTKILCEYFEGQELAVYENKLLQNVSKIKTTPQMERILSEANGHEQFKGGLGHLFLESKVMELLSVYLREVLELDILQDSRFYISRTDRETLSEIKEYLDSQIAYAPSCAELARKAHMSSSKISRCFSQMYGMPIHTYVIEQRLEKAAYLLTESDLPVYRVGILVGYAKPSNFTAAFKRKYGVTPKDYKREIKTDFG